MQHNEAVQQMGVNEGFHKGKRLVLMSHLSQLAYGGDGKGAEETVRKSREQEKGKASYISWSLSHDPQDPY